jgi:3'(2'), 5'-bisphosphate nucleotidase
VSAESVLRQLLGREATVACQAVAEGACLAKWIRRQGAVGMLAKSDASPVTVADFAVQALITARLTEVFPDVPIVAEEDLRGLQHPDAAAIKDAVVQIVRCFVPRIDPDRILDAVPTGTASGERFWTLDPVDGTKGFLQDRQYAVALALIERNVVQLAVLGCPHLSFKGRRTARVGSDVTGAGGIAVAVRGRGAWWGLPLDEEMLRLSVSSTASLAQARVLHSLEAAHSNVADLVGLLRSAGNRVEPLLLDSQAKHVVLAAGRADLLLRFPRSPDIHDAIWDQAAGSRLIEEAGGRVTDLGGSALDFSTGSRLLRNAGLLASNARLHDAAMNALVATGISRCLQP